MTEPIDFVIAWVDGSDSAWRRNFDRWKALYTPAAYVGSETADPGTDTSEERYRDYGMLRYWFRAAERFAPWVGNIYLLTWGHIPQWLDVSHPKLRVVRHEEFIPERYLPTFSSCPIELNMHRIGGLSEKFVYFNDDMFLCRPVAAERFFRNGLPCDAARLSVIRDEQVDHNKLECMRIINMRHARRGAIARNAGKWFNPRYTISDMIKTATLLPWSFWPGFQEYHMPQPFLKSTFERMWREQPDQLDSTCLHRFRTPNDVSQWLMRYEQLASGTFHPTGMRDTLLCKLSDDNRAIAEAITSGRYSMICINDNNEIRDPQAAARTVRDAFDALLPEKSAYEL